ncbi:DUF2147 domain-containing protein [Sphingomonas sanxanigenens]|uniref:DUF2147 domain-containing protein n=1 Tax=Sphingomonas sanxanigenens DSM 19645 = NX02 TaxID=1123269 RepID=W0AAI7_9SPHN|nr:DUF2147 domain-containing protein [Sphingomonas sanxanigenens]AHE54954.1 hypothetical protein NX02_16375 [Sphingomonas sanxanigenens DSM 19645 = NX02]
MPLIIRQPLAIASIMFMAVTLPARASFAQASAAAEVIGIWETEDRGMKFEMFDAGGSYSGRMLFGRRAMEADGKTFRKDSKNPDPALRGRSLQGVVFLTGFKWDARNQRWDGGSMYDGTSGRTYSARITMAKGAMELRGYMGTPMLGRTLKLHRVR